MSYRQLYERLKAWEPKALIEGTLMCDDGRCAMGAALGADILQFYGKPGAYALAGDHLGLTPEELSTVIRANDMLLGTPEERYEKMLTWLEERIKEET